MKIKILLALIVAGFLTNAFAFRQMKPMTDEEIRTDIVNGLIKSYEQACPCPFSKDPNSKDPSNPQGKPCGSDSDYFRSRGSVMCYPEDIADSEVSAYRQKYNIIDPLSDPNYQYTSPANVYKQREQPLDKEQQYPNQGGYQTNR